MNARAQVWGMEFFQLSPGTLVAEYTHIRTPRLLYSVASYTTGLSTRGTTPLGTCIVSIAVRGDPHVMGGKLGDSVCAFARGGQPFALVAPQPSEVFGVVFEEAALEGAVRSRLDASLDGFASQARLHLQSPESRERLLATWRILLALALENRGELLAGSAMARALEEATFDALCEAVDPVIRSERTDAGRALLARRAEELLRARMYEGVRLGELADALQTTLRNLELGFQEVFGTAPSSYHTALRMNGARRELRAAGRATTVSSIAMRWGFTHLGRFSVAYRRMFSESPSETARGARQ